MHLLWVLCWYCGYSVGTAGTPLALRVLRWYCGYSHRETSLIEYSTHTAATAAPNARCVLTLPFTSAETNLPCGHVAR
jgi:hypothetical protein